MPTSSQAIPSSQDVPMIFQKVHIFSMTPIYYLHGGTKGGQGGGGVKENSFEGNIAVMLLLVKCYDKKYRFRCLLSGHLTIGQALGA